MGARTLDATELAALIRACDPIAVAARLPAPGPTVTFTRSPPPEDWLVDGASERPVAEHRDAHEAGRPSEATVAYGAGVDAAAVAERLLALAALVRESALLRAVCPVPAEPPDATRPGSWGVEDLTVVAAARLALPDVPWVRPDWRIGAGACQVALAFGANDLALPAGDRTDVATLVAAVGREAVER